MMLLNIQKGGDSVRRFRTPKIVFCVMDYVRLKENCRLDTNSHTYPTVLTLRAVHHNKSINLAQIKLVSNIFAQFLRWLPTEFVWFVPYLAFISFIFSNLLFNVYFVEFQISNT